MDARETPSSLWTMNLDPFSGKGVLPVLFGKPPRFRVCGPITVPTTRPLPFQLFLETGQIRSTVRCIFESRPRDPAHRTGSCLDMRTRGHCSVESRLFSGFYV